MHQALTPALEWFNNQKWSIHDFQKQAWLAYFENKNGIVNAPTGSGKTYSLLLPILCKGLTQNKKKKGIKAIWITPIKALSKEIELASNRAIHGVGSRYTVAIRTGDTSQKDKQRIKKSPPDILITTPETLHILIAQKGYSNYFSQLECVVVDEWHELMGSKRGVQVELALSRLKRLQANLKIWGISATIGNLKEALDVLLGPHSPTKNQILIRTAIQKKYKIKSVLPRTIDTLPWAGHLGIALVKSVISVLKKSESTLVFTNTRSQAEIWYQKILDLAPEFAGQMAMHHSAINREIRSWVESALHDGKLKVVVCTSSLDLGVDFRPVENIVQIGSPKGIARFTQRAGRSGHQPGATSTIHFVPTHALELIEASALRQAIDRNIIEDRTPYLKSFDVLMQYLVTLAVSDGFSAEQIYHEVCSTHCFQALREEEWHYVLQFICNGGSALNAYDDYHKTVLEDGVFKVINRRIALRHRLSIGTIVGDNATIIKFKRGKKIGTIEEWFISRLKIGDAFWFAGQTLELIGTESNIAYVKKSKKTKASVPSWQGGRMPLSSKMSSILRETLDDYLHHGPKDLEMKKVAPLLERQKATSLLPSKKDFLIEYFTTEEGYHALFYPFEGRFVNEGIGALIAYRISKMQAISLSIAINDYGFELLSDQPIPIREALESDLFTLDNLHDDIMSSANNTEMARKKFRDIATISGLLFKGYPGRMQKDRHTQTSAQLIFKVLQLHEPDSLLLQQAYQEVLDFQLEEHRLKEALERINKQEFKLTTPNGFTPLSFPIIVDRLRESVSSETLQQRIKKMAVLR